MVQSSENGPIGMYFYVPEIEPQIGGGWFLHKFISLPTYVLTWKHCPYVRVIGGEIWWRYGYSLERCGGWTPSQPVPIYTQRNFGAAFLVYWDSPWLAHFHMIEPLYVPIKGYTGL